MDDSPTDRNRKTRNVSWFFSLLLYWFFSLLHRLNRKRKINEIPSVQEDPVSNERQAASKEEIDLVLEERISSFINYQLHRRDDEITMLKNKILRLEQDVERLLSNPNVDTISRKTNNSNLSQTGDKAGASCSKNKEQQPSFGTGFYNAMRKLQNRKKADKNRSAFRASQFDIFGARPTPHSSWEPLEKTEDL